MNEHDISEAIAASISENDPAEETESECEDAEEIVDIEENEELNELSDNHEQEEIEEIEVNEKVAPDPGEELTYSWMPDEYRWKDWLNKKLFPELSKKYQHDGKPKKLCPDMISMGTTITPTDMNNRCEYLGWKLEKKYLLKCKTEIACYKKKFFDTIDIILSHFIMDIARKLNFGKDKNGNPLKNWNDLLLAVEASEKILDCKKVLVFTYLIFDWLPFYQLQIARFVTKIHNVKIFNKNKTKEYVAGSSDFLQKMVSQALNIIRKQINDYASASVGFKYTIIRYGPYLAEKKGTNDNRKKKHFYGWMIRYDAVSFFYDLVIIRLIWLLFV